MSCGGTKWKLLSKRQVQLPGYRFTNVSRPTDHIFQFASVSGCTIKGLCLKCAVVIFMNYHLHFLLMIAILRKLGLLF